MILIRHHMGNHSKRLMPARAALTPTKGGNGETLVGVDRTAQLASLELARACSVPEMNTYCSHDNTPGMSVFIFLV